MQHGYNAFADFWERYWSGAYESQVHPDDAPFFEKREPRGKHRHVANFDLKHHPCPFDGPLETARVILCLANPKYEGLPGVVEDQNRIIKRMRNGRAPLPCEWWRFYEKTFAEFLKQGLPVDELKTQFAVFNVCSYASTDMNGPEVAHAAGLPSTWAAQNYLRSVLIPRAQQTGQRDDVYLIFLRKHQLWGVTEGFAGNIDIVRGRERGGVVPQETAKRVMKWLRSQSSKGYSSMKQEHSIRKSVALKPSNMQPTINLEHSLHFESALRKIATLSSGAEGDLRRLALETIPSELLAYLSRLLTELQKLKVPPYQNRGSSTSIPTLVRELERRKYQHFGELINWIYKNKNPKDSYLPFGELKYGDLGSYTGYLNFCQQEKARLAEHQYRQQMQEKDAQERRALRQAAHLRKQNRNEC